MEAHKDLAIVLKSIQFEERHRIITAMTQAHGLVSAIARNSVQSKRFGGALDLFAASDWIFQVKPHGELVLLKEAQVRSSFENLRKNFEKYSLSSALTEFILRVAPHNQTCPELFQLHANALYALDQPDQETQKAISKIFFLNCYLMKLLQWSGNQPQLEACLQCQTNLNVLEPAIETYSLIADAGWVCPTCKDHSQRRKQETSTQGFINSFFKVSARALQETKLSLRTPIRRLLIHSISTPQEQAELFRWLEALFIYHIPGFDQKPMKSLRFLGLESSLQKLGKSD